MCMHALGVRACRACPTYLQSLEAAKVFLHEMRKLARFCACSVVGLGRPRMHRYSACEECMWVGAVLGAGSPSYASVDDEVRVAHAAGIHTDSGTIWGDTGGGAAVQAPAQRWRQRRAGAPWRRGAR